MTLKKLIGASLWLLLASGQVIAAGLPAESCQGCQSCQPGCQSCEQCQHCPDGNGWHPQGCSCHEGIPLECPPNPLEPARPTPPPCCADGYCYPNPVTWGYYKTRWRHWPVEYVAATPTGPGGIQPGQPPGPGFEGYVLPPPDEEDRRAPPPTIPKRPEGAAPAQPTERPVEPGQPMDEGPPAAPSEPGAPSGTAPTEESPDSLFGVPFEEAPATTPLTPPPPTEETPSTTPLGLPTGDADPPPALPFKSSDAAGTQTRPAAAPATAPQRSTNRPVQGDDPPPAFPLARVH